MEAQDKDLLLPSYYGQHGYPHQRWAYLRRHDPVHWVEDWAGDPYWAITKHAHIIEISKNPGSFSNIPRFMLKPLKGISKEPFRSILDMDPPEHREYRALVSRRFTPQALTRIKSQVHRICDEVIDAASTGGKEVTVDFVNQVAARMPIWVIAEMIGVPREDWENMYHWTNTVVGAADPEYQEGRTFEETRLYAIQQMGSYFKALIEERRRTPGNDLATDLALAQIHDGPVPEFELLTYMNTLLTAGNETTRNATTGGMMLLIQHPDQFERLRQDISLLDSFVEEVLRCVSPVIHMARTAVKDVEIGGKTIRKGQAVVLFYPSANRDDDVFEAANEFRLDRDPNPHLAFGIGEHFCLGTHVARMELRAIFDRLVQRLDSVELAGAVDRLQDNLVGGIKRMPVRYRIRNAA